MDAKESQIYIAIIIALIIVGSAICYFFYSIVQQQKRVRRLERENADAQIQLLEKDRERIARDLHDEISPTLAAVNLWVQSFELERQSDKDYLVKCNEKMESLSVRLREISFDLMPKELKRDGLVKSVEQFVNFITLRNALAIHLGMSDNIDLDEQKIVHTYRVVQEIIHNTVKHARATELTIVLLDEKDHVVLATRDDGTGFDYKQQLNNSKGLGLKSLLNRISLLQADLLMDSKPGEGTSITIRIPKYGKAL